MRGGHSGSAVSVHGRGAVTRFVPTRGGEPRIFRLHYSLLTFSCQQGVSTSYLGSSETDRTSLDCDRELPIRVAMTTLAIGG
jgi:hypothetical protein